MWCSSSYQCFKFIFTRLPANSLPKTLQWEGTHVSTTTEAVDVWSWQARTSVNWRGLLGLTVHLPRSRICSSSHRASPFLRGLRLCSVIAVEFTACCTTYFCSDIGVLYDNTRPCSTSIYEKRWFIRSRESAGKSTSPLGTPWGRRNFPLLTWYTSHDTFSPLLVNFVRTSICPSLVFEHLV